MKKLIYVLLLSFPLISFSQNLAYNYVSENHQPIIYLIGDKYVGYEIKSLEDTNKLLRVCDFPVLTNFVIHKSRYKSLVLCDSNNVEKNTQIKNIKLKIKRDNKGAKIGVFYVVGKSFTCQLSTEKGYIFDEDSKEVVFVDRNVRFKIIKK